MATNTELLQQILVELRTRNVRENQENRENDRAERRANAKPGPIKTGLKKVGKGISGAVSKSSSGVMSGLKNTALMTGLMAAAVPFIDGVFNTAIEAFGDNPSIGKRIIAGFSELFSKIASIFGVDVNAVDLSKDIVEYTDRIGDSLNTIVKALENTATLAKHIANNEWDKAFDIIDAGIKVDKNAETEGPNSTLTALTKGFTKGIPGFGDDIKRIGQDTVLKARTDYVTKPTAYTPPVRNFTVSDDGKVTSNKTGKELKGGARDAALRTHADDLAKAKSAKGPGLVKTMVKAGQGALTEATGSTTAKLGTATNMLMLPVQAYASYKEGEATTKRTGSTEAGVAVGTSSFSGAIAGASMGGALTAMYLGPAAVTPQGAAAVLIGTAMGGMIGEAGMKEVSQFLYGDPASITSKIFNDTSDTNTELKYQTNNISGTGMYGQAPIVYAPSTTTNNATAVTSSLKTSPNKDKMVRMDYLTGIPGLN